MGLRLISTTLQHRYLILGSNLHFVELSSLRIPGLVRITKLGVVMNAKCYRTVFNAARGMLVAVEES
ncbi:ESPR-type extended signal peptide-containing protein, partial [Ralstonia pseudosolanacearum]|uniref:ESPR-type extended signal peptide-containing protein n=1 Tax=Ralstonia pseudosolanacearum TaxID=1310165 RepID=UPI002917016D